MDWKQLLACVTGSIDEELLLRNEYLTTENRILRGQLKSRLPLTDGNRRSLAEIGKRLGRKALEDVATIVRPETVLAGHRRLVAKSFDGSRKRGSPGRHPVAGEVEGLVVQLAMPVYPGANRPSRRRLLGGRRSTVAALVLGERPRETAALQRAFPGGEPGRP